MFYIDSDNKLAYLDSLNVKVFPSGRRKSELVDTYVNDKTEQKRYIPIDPEARLNTEANNRKHSGLNGYKQSYILDTNTESISLVLAGYLFNIKLSGTYSNGNSIQKIGEYLASNIKDTSNNPVVNDEIYVNILTTDVTFFTSVDGSGSHNSEVGTEILRDQAFNGSPNTCLDLLKANSSPDKAASYYFSGLSFSAEPLEDIKKNENDGLPAYMHPESLLFLTKDTEGNWHIYEPSRLPKIDHGETKNSVEISGNLTIKHKRDDKGDIETRGDLEVEGNVTAGGTLTASEVIIGDMKAITLEVAEVSTDKWQLRFNNAKVSPLPLE